MKKVKVVYFKPMYAHGGGFMRLEVVSDGRYINRNIIIIVIIIIIIIIVIIIEIIIIIVIIIICST